MRERKDKQRWQIVIEHNVDKDRDTHKDRAMEKQTERWTGRK